MRVSDKLLSAFPNGEFRSNGQFLFDKGNEYNYFYIMDYEDMYTTVYKLLRYVPGYMFPRDSVDSSKFTYFFEWS